jgi:uncharacterized protein YceK
MRGMRSVLKRLWVAAALLVSIAGCQTTRSWDDGCPGVYSGVRYFSSQRSSLPWDGKVFFTFDLPLTVVFDTLLLPASAWVDRDKPTGGWVVGCRWAD